MSEKENRRSRLTRRLLRDALLELLKEKNISQITIKAICQQADLNRTTFYLHYPDQYALMDALIEDVYQNTVNYMDQVITTANQEYLTAFLEYIRSNADTFRTLLIINPDTRLVDKLIALSDENIVRFTPGFPDGVEGRYIRTFLSQGCFHMLTDWIRSDFDLPISTLTQLHWQLSNAVCQSAADIAAESGSARIP